MSEPAHDRVRTALPSRRTILGSIVLVASSELTLSQETRRVTDNMRLLGADDTISDLLRHPAFAGFARKLLPWDDRAYDEQLKLSAIGGLLPYHTHVDIPTTVGALNRLIDDRGRGLPVHFDIYTDAEKREIPAKANAGLFFYRGQAGAPFAIISPGGGFAYVGSVHEGLPYAAEISKAGLNAFVLKYRAGQGQSVATQDLAAAISFVFKNAGALDVSTRGYSLWGSSAGARMAASIGSHGVARFGGEDLAKPSVVVLAYTAHADSTEREPPTFVVVGDQDGISPPSAMERRVNDLRRKGTQVEYRVFEQVGHGFGLGIGASAEGWVTEALHFWMRHQSG
jgi:acetyl esterase/lipase